MYITYTQCGNLRICLSLRFYVKSIFGEFTVSQLTFIVHYELALLTDKYFYYQFFYCHTVYIMQIILPKQCSIFHFLQIEKCQDVTLGYSTEKKCDKWPKTVCELETVTRKRYTPETKCTKKPRQVRFTV